MTAEDMPDASPGFEWYRELADDDLLSAAYADAYWYRRASIDACHDCRTGGTCPDHEHDNHRAQSYLDARRELKAQT